MCRDSTKVKVASTGITLKTKSREQAHDAISRAKARLRHKTLVGTVEMERTGLGSLPNPHYEAPTSRKSASWLKIKIRTEVGENTTARWSACLSKGCENGTNLPRQYFPVL